MTDGSTAARRDLRLVLQLRTYPQGTSPHGSIPPGKGPYLSPPPWRAKINTILLMLAFEYT